MAQTRWNSNQNTKRVANQPGSILTKPKSQETSSFQASLCDRTRNPNKKREQIALCGGAPGEDF